MINIHNKMTTIADNTRILSGTSDKLKLDDINTNLDEIVKETDVQYELLQDIKNALANKGGNGGSGGEASGSKIPLVTKTGTTTSATIDTGLSEIVAISLFKGSVSSEGLITAAAIVPCDTVNYIGCSNHGQYVNTYTHNIQKVTMANYCTIQNGTFEWINTSNALKFVSGKTYNWYAVGYE